MRRFLLTCLTVALTVSGAARADIKLGYVDLLMKPYRR